MMCLQLDATAMGRVYILTEKETKSGLALTLKTEDVLYNVGTFPLHCHMMTHA